MNCSSEFFSLIQNYLNELFVTVFLFMFMIVYFYIHRPLNFIYRTYDGNNTKPSTGFGFPNSWIPVCDSDELKSHSIKKINFCQNNIILLRSSANGKPYALDSYCPHLGADFSVGGKIVTNCESDCIRCPFHGWVFRVSDGAVVEVPYSKNKNVPMGVKVKTWECIEQNGFIYVWYHSEGKKPSWFPPKIDQIQSGEWDFLGRAEFIYNCSLLDSAENIADQPHADIIHEPIFMSLKNLEPINVPLLNMISTKNTFNWGKCDPPEMHKSYANICSKIYIFDKFSPFTMIADPVEQYGACIIHIPKNIKFGPFSFEVIMVVGQTPIGCNGCATKLVQRIYYKPSWLFKILGRLYFFIAIQNICRDIVIFNNKIYIEKPPYIKEDKQLSSFRRWILQFYVNQSKIVNKDNLSW